MPTEKKKIVLPRYLIISILPICLLGLFTTFSCQPTVVNSTQRERETAIKQLKQAIDRSGGKISNSELSSFEQNYPKSRAAALARFLRAYQLYTAKQYAEAAPLFDEVIIKEGTDLGDYALYFQGSAYRELGDLKRAQDTFAQLAESYPQSLFLRDAQYAAGECAFKQNDPKQALKLLDKLIEAKDGGALWIAGQCYEQNSKIDKAIETYRDLYYGVPQSNESEQAATRLTALGYKPLEGGKDGYKLAQTRADRLFEAGQFGRAVEMYTKIQTEYPDQAGRPKNSLRLGISLNNLNRYREAVTPLQAVPVSEKEIYAEARYQLARAYLKQKLMAQFAEIANQLIAKPLPPDRGAELLTALIGFYDNSGQADRYRKQLIRDYAQTKEADKESYNAAWKIHNDRRYQDAAEALLQHLANFPDTEFRGQTAYWAGKNADRSGNPARAAAIYQALLRRYRSGYYGYLAEQQLKDFQRRGIKAEQPAAGSLLAKALDTIKPAAALPETATEKAEPRLQRAQNLQVIRLSDLALTELEVALKDAPTSNRINFAIASIFSERHETLRAVRTLQRAHPDYLLYQGNEAPREVLEIFFPLIEWETIKAEAARHNLDPFIVAGLIRQESVFDPRVRSRANALGLMQLLPSTGKLVARKQGSGNISAEQLYNPQLNIKLGTAYLAEMVARYGGRIEYAAAAYNGGPGRVDRWRKTLPEDLEDWVEAIPITETRLYVQGVLRNASHYRRIYGERK